jgi:phosphate acetyltransferase
LLPINEKMLSNLIRKVALNVSSNSLVVKRMFSSTVDKFPQNLYVVNEGAHSSAPILIGLMDYMLRHVPSVGFFQPIGCNITYQSNSNGYPIVPKNVAIMDRHFNLCKHNLAAAAAATAANTFNQPPPTKVFHTTTSSFPPSLGRSSRSSAPPSSSLSNELPTPCYGISESEALRLLSVGRGEEMIETIFSAYTEYKKSKEFVLLDGSGLASVDGMLEIHGKLAAELDARVLIIADFPPPPTYGLHRTYSGTNGGGGRGFLHGDSSSSLTEGALEQAASRPDEEEDEIAEKLYQADDLITKCLIAKQELTAVGAEVAGVIFNRIPTAHHASLTGEITQKLRAAELPFAGGFPYDRKLASVRLNEISSALGAVMLYGDAEGLDSTVEGVLVCSQDVGRFFDKLQYLNDKRHNARLPPLHPLIVTSSDRLDVVLSLAGAHACGAGPHIAGLLLTDAHSAGSGSLATTAATTTTTTTTGSPSSRLGSVATGKVLQKLSHQLFPVMQVPFGLFETTRRVASELHSQILPDSTSKMQRAEFLFSQYIDLSPILAMPANGTGNGEPRLTPRKFTHQIYEMCRANPQRIVLPESHDKRILTAAAEVTTRGLASVTLLGDPATVKETASKWHIDISGIAIIDPHTDPRAHQYAEIFTEARKGKGMTVERALEELQTDPNTFGTLMVKAGHADGMVSGASGTTAATIRPALQVLRSSPDALASSVFFMALPDKVLAYADCAVMIDPTAEQLATIAADTADTAAAFGIEPRVAMLSYSTLGSGSGPAVDKVIKATEIVKAERPDLAVEGPIQYDAAVNPVIGAQKVKGRVSAVAGKATVCIFPDLNTGNNTYKAVQQSTGAVAIGPLLQGLMKPVNDLSRGCTVVDIVNTVACTSLQAVGVKKKMRMIIEEQGAGGKEKV